MRTVWSIGQGSIGAMLKVHCLLNQKQMRNVIIRGFPVKFNDIILPSIYPSTGLIATAHGSLYDNFLCFYF